MHHYMNYHETFYNRMSLENVLPSYVPLFCNMPPMRMYELQTTVKIFSVEFEKFVITVV